MLSCLFVCLIRSGYFAFPIRSTCSSCLIHKRESMLQLQKACGTYQTGNQTIQVSLVHSLVLKLNHFLQAFTSLIMLGTESTSFKKIQDTPLHRIFSTKCLCTVHSFIFLCTNYHNEINYIAEKNETIVVADEKIQL